jgi:hypothetical protein
MGAALDSELEGAYIDLAMELEYPEEFPDFDVLRLGSRVGMRIEVKDHGNLGWGGGNGSGERMEEDTDHIQQQKETQIHQQFQPLPQKLTLMPSRLEPYFELHL